MPSSTEHEIVQSELRWGAITIATVSVIMLAVIFAAVAMHINPPSNVERVDPQALHLSAEFTESNLGT